MVFISILTLFLLKELNEVDSELDGITGMEPNQIDYDCTILECHVDLDLEGYEDVDDDGEPTGIKIPYVVTLSLDNGQVLSIRRNYLEDDEQRKKIQYFTHYKFLPGFGFYGLGLIHTIGGLSRTATAALRQLIDAGTLSNLPAGFKPADYGSEMTTIHCSRVSFATLTHPVGYPGQPHAATF